MDVTLEGEPLTGGGDRHAARRHRGAGAAARPMGRDRPPAAGACLAPFRGGASALAEREGLTFAEAMRLLAGAAVTQDDEDAAVADWSQVSAGPWLAETLKAMRGTPMAWTPIPVRP